MFIIDTISNKKTAMNKHHYKKMYIFHSMQSSRDFRLALEHFEFVFRKGDNFPTTNNALQSLKNPEP